MAGELILLVNEKTNIHQVEHLYPERESCGVESVIDGKAAPRVIDKFRPILVAPDVIHPKVDGLEICRQLKFKNNLVPVMMVTTQGEDIDKPSSFSNS